MKIKMIHCADLHLDSKMSGNLSAEKAKERRNEILATFRKMVSYAVKNRIGFILIAGDLYDKKNISATARNMIVKEIADHPAITFFYLKGNHDADTVIKGFEELPKNLLLFTEDSWRSYKLGDTGLVVTGVELTEENNHRIFDSLVLDSAAYNLVMLHGQTVDSFMTPGVKASGKEGMIPLRSLSGKGIDYLALGHIHAFSQGKLDNRGIWCYPGCLEGRGFDECGKHGFVELTIDTVTHVTDRRMIAVAGRNLHEVRVELDGCRDIHEVLAAAQRTLSEAKIPADDLVKVILQGSIEMDCQVDVDFLAKQLDSGYYFLKVADETTIRIDYDSFALDTSLKGEFVRLVKGDSTLTEEEKAQIIAHGINLLMGDLKYED